MLTVATVAIMAVLVASLSFTTAVNLRTSENAVAELANRQATLSALEIVGNLRTSKEKGPDQKKYEYMLGETRLEILFVDEESKINVNKLLDSRGQIEQATRERLERLFSRYSPDWEGMVERLADYIDPDAKGLYETGAKNAPLDTIDELLFIDGFTSELFYRKPGDDKPGLRDCLTLESTGVVNVNTAPAPVLMAISDAISENTADAIVKERGREPFGSVHDLVGRGVMDQRTYDKIRQGLTIKGSTIHVRITAETDGAVKMSEARLTGSGKSARVQYLREVQK